MKLILISKPTFFVEEDKILTTLFEEGLEILHLRKPDTPPVYAERLLTLIPEKFRRRIVVHSNFYLKDEYKLKGIHLNKRNPRPPENYSGHISCSCHTIEEVASRKGPCSYVFLSPIFDSISKNGYNSPFTLDQLKAASKSGIIDKKVIALGGIDEENLPKIKDLGFGGVAVLGSLWEKFDPASDYSYRNLIEHFRKLKRLAE